MRANNIGLNIDSTIAGLGTDRSYYFSNKTYMTVSTSASINYDENIQIKFSVQSGVVDITPQYAYSILLIPDNN